eukprot:2059189-Amphidinium_carterae.1
MALWQHRLTRSTLHREYDKLESKSLTSLPSLFQTTRIVQPKNSAELAGRGGESCEDARGAAGPA